MVTYVDAIRRLSLKEQSPASEVTDREERGQGLELLEDRDGQIEVISGKVIVTDPSGNGRYPAINPCDPNVDVFVNGHRIDGITIVTEADSIELKETPPRGGGGGGGYTPGHS